MMNKELRIDKWLWSVRIFKTRSLASEACRAGKVKIKGIPVKASRSTVLKEEVTISLPPITKTIKVIGFPANRVSAKLAVDFVEDLTPPEEYKKIELLKDHRFVYRDRGTGRPTKKERRDIDNVRF
jgi:ribosome-associated heat shock protein Hsp15